MSFGNIGPIDQALAAGQRAQRDAGAEAGVHDGARL